MRKLRYGFLLLLLACLAGALLTASADNYVDQNGVIPDQNVYWGTQETTYQQILNSHMSRITQYESRVILYNDTDDQVPCRPVGFTDITGDSIPELIFMEIANGGRGDLYVYSSNGSSTRCVLYVPGIAYPDYDYWLGFDIYLSSNGGGTLVIEHYQLEKPWVLQLAYNGQRYNLTNYYTIDEDHTGIGYDQHYRNGQLISYFEYDSALEALRNSKTRIVSEYFGPNNAYYGFAYTWNGAIQALGGGGSGQPSASYGYVRVTHNLVNFRRTPNGEVFYEVTLNTVWPVTGPTVNNGGYAWYPVSVNGQAGYLRGDCVVKLTDAEAAAWQSGQTGPTAPPSAGKAVYGLTIDKLATRKGPGTQYEGGGTYNVKGQYIQVLAKAYDKRNGIWWVKCVIPYHGEQRILWTGYKRFDHSTLSLDQLPEEKW